MGGGTESSERSRRPAQSAYVLFANLNETTKNAKSTKMDSESVEIVPESETMLPYPVAGKAGPPCHRIGPLLKSSFIPPKHQPNGENISMGQLTSIAKAGPPSKAVFPRSDNKPARLKSWALHTGGDS